MKVLIVILALLASACGEMNPMQSSGTSKDHNQKQTAGSTVSILD